MSSIGKISSSLLSVPAELTVTAANLNFDFSLVKIEAPKEFHGVRDSLSKFRRDEAESGLPHITARKLGALFESLVPPIPNLLSAYGERVSEISSKMSDNNSRPTQPNFGLFASQAGPDATNIWAAATSGRSALAVQLLACMLARIWKDHEAISLWVELVEHRRLEIQSTEGEGSNIAALMAAQQMFTREQLAAWDSSARSWIQTADAAKRVQQTQLMLIISNVELPVNTSTNPYESVTKAWVSAMTAMERLVQGIPQQIRDGATLLAISAWHLYPNMTVLSDVMKIVEQNDSLMGGSLLTFAVHASSENNVSSGVFWSLPMARMRYYSPPVFACGRLTPDTSRVPMDEFLIVVLGMVISPWVPASGSEGDCCRLIILLRDLISECLDDPDLDSLEWLSMLAESAKQYLDSSGMTSQQYTKLLGLGLRSRLAFLSHPSDLPQDVFGLADFPALLGLIPDENVEDKLLFLRKIAPSLGVDAERLKIRYNPRAAWYPRGQAISDEVLFNDAIQVGYYGDELGSAEDQNPACRYEFASVLPLTRAGQKRTADGQAHASQGHRRWIFTSERRDEHEAKTVCTCVDLDVLPTAPLCSSCYIRTRHQRVSDLGEELTFLQLWEIKDRNETEFYSIIDNDGVKAISSTWLFCLGDTFSCGIFMDSECHPLRPWEISVKGKPATTAYIEALLASSHVDRRQLHTHLLRWFLGSSQRASLSALVFAKSFYKQLDGATISLEVLKVALYKEEWANLDFHRQASQIRLATAFSCLAMFESGQFVVSPTTLIGVMAMSSHDSIYVASELVCDPSDGTSGQLIQRVFGNLGRSGMAFLVSPASPRLREVDPRAWHLINHIPFDGQFIDSFEGTSLHLSFTDFELPLDVGTRGLRDRQAVLLESCITLNDKGTDLGDLDLLSIFHSDLVIRAKPCNHVSLSKGDHGCDDNKQVGDNPTCHPGARVSHPAQLTSLDCWDELFDPPTSSTGIFRACGNWQARLAAAAACRQMGRRVHILPSKPCTLCIGSADELKGLDILIA